MTGATDTVTCACGNEFDPDRDPAIPGGTSERCPDCGAEADVPATDGEDGAAATVEAGGEVIEIHVHVHRDG